MRKSDSVLNFIRISIIAMGCYTLLGCYGGWKTGASYSGPLYTNPVRPGGECVKISAFPGMPFTTVQRSFASAFIRSSLNADRPVRVNDQLISVPGPHPGIFRSATSDGDVIVETDASGQVIQVDVDVANDTLNVSN